jgi:hypothetical protein
VVRVPAAVTSDTVGLVIRAMKRWDAPTRCSPVAVVTDADGMSVTNILGLVRTQVLPVSGRGGTR